MVEPKIIVAAGLWTKAILPLLVATNNEPITSSSGSELICPKSKYQENRALFIEYGKPDLSFFQRAAVRFARFFSRAVPERRIENLVFSERLVEYPLLFMHWKFQPGQHILEFGCLESLLSMQLCSLGYKVTGFDVQPYPFSHENFDFIQCDILDWQPEPEIFDGAIAISTVEHVGLGAYGDKKCSRGDRVAIQKLLGALKVGGYLYLTVPAGRRFTYVHPIHVSYRVYESREIKELVPGIEVLRFFYKSGRYSSWRECTCHEIDNLVYEDYSAMAPVQAVAFIVAKKTRESLK